MDKEEIIDTIKILAAHQGFYGRLYDALMSADEESVNDWFNETFAEEPQDIVDMVRMIEGC